MLQYQDTLNLIQMKKKEINSSRMPIYRDAGFELYDAGTAADAFNKETEQKRVPDIYIYSRYRNPTVVAAEEEIMKVEDSSWALLTQSGMSAIDMSVFFEIKYLISRGISSLLSLSGGRLIGTICIL